MFREAMNKFDRAKLVGGPIVGALPSHINPTPLSFPLSFPESFPGSSLNSSLTSIRADRSFCGEDDKIESTNELLTLACI